MNGNETKKKFHLDDELLHLDDVENIGKHVRKILIDFTQQLPRKNKNKR